MENILLRYVKYVTTLFMSKPAIICLNFWLPFSFYVSPCLTFNEGTNHSELVSTF